MASLTQVANMNSLVLFASLCVLGSAWADVVTPCVEGQPPLYDGVKIYVDGVECTESPCQLKRGSEAACDITFTALRTVDTLIKKVNATVVDTGIVTPFPLPGADKGCDSLKDGAYCPLDAGEQATLTVTMPVLEIYPKVQLSLEFFVLDQTQEQEACFLLDAHVVD